MPQPILSWNDLVFFRCAGGGAAKLGHGSKHHRARTASRHSSCRSVFCVHLFAEAPALSIVLDRGLGALCLALPWAGACAVVRFRLLHRFVESHVVRLRGHLLLPWHATVHSPAALDCSGYRRRGCNRPVVRGEWLELFLGVLLHSRFPDFCWRRVPVLAGKPAPRNTSGWSAEHRVRGLGADLPGIPVP